MSAVSRPLFGYLLGETFRMQKKLGICNVSDPTIFGMLNGMEDVLREVEARIPVIPDGLVKKAADILQPYLDDPTKPLSGYYQIEKELDAAGIDRGRAIVIFTYFKASGFYSEVIEKLNTTESPIECKTFDLDPKKI
jgi:hypothetical protein